MAEMIRLQQQIAPQMSYAWSGLSYQQNQASGQAPLLYALSVLVVFCALRRCMKAGRCPCRCCWCCRWG
jgi:multidrug efflux pump